MSDASILNDKRRIADEISLSERARRDIAQVFDQYGMPCHLPPRPGRSAPQIEVGTRVIQLWPKVVVTRKKFTPHQQLAEAAAFARFADGHAVPLVVHKRPSEPFTVTLFLEDFCPIIYTADEALEERGKDE